MPNQLKIALKWAIALTALVASLGPAIAILAGLIPGHWSIVLTGFVTAAASIHEFLAESPLTQPLLATKTTAQVLLAANQREDIAAASKRSTLIVPGKP
jgi:hypothetical protein